MASIDPVTGDVTYAAFFDSFDEGIVHFPDTWNVDVSVPGQVTLHSRETIASAAQALGDPGLNDHRFRHNIVIEGVEAWEELSWLGRRVRIGAVEMDVVKPKTRCLATHANPETGQRDLMVMQGLVKHFRQEQPTLGIGMLTHGAGGVLHIGDEIRLMA